MVVAAKKPRVERMFRACSDRTRLRLLSLLRDGELCVCDLVAVIGAPQPTVSRHLAYLRSAGLVLARRDGLWAYYRLAPAVNKTHRKLLDCLDQCAAELPQLASDARRAKTCCTRPAGCCPA
jgi:ArsR family transcriptional regulator, arsenate/arsenite/antimonite-responsive transcriptional repressor